MSARIEHSFDTRCSPEQCWQIYTSPRKSWDKLFGETHWIKGKPYQTGSVAESEVIGLGSSFQRRIIGVTSGKEIGWINHGFSMTGEQWITFIPLEDGGTRVQTWNEIHGNLDTFDGLPAVEGLKQRYIAWMAQFQAECDRRAAESGA